MTFKNAEGYALSPLDGPVVLSLEAGHIVAFAGKGFYPASHEALTNQNGLRLMYRYYLK